MMNPKVRVAIRFIVYNSHSDIYIAEVADEVRLSTSYLSHLFKTEVGMPGTQDAKPTGQSYK
jgi:AraC-like DNA-binding protein